MKSGPRIEYHLPLSVIRKAIDLGVDLKTLKAMVVMSARMTHPAGNRRYHNFVFQVEGSMVYDITKLDEEEDDTFYKCDNCKDQKKIAVFDQCPLCEGFGCRRCDKGYVQNFIPCPSCSAKKI